MSQKYEPNPQVEPSWDLDALAIDNADSYEELVSQLFQIRKYRKLTQQEVANRMSTSNTAVSRLESGNGNPTAHTLQDYAEAVGAYLAFAAVPAHNMPEFKELSRSVTQQLRGKFFCEIPGNSIERTGTEDHKSKIYEVGVPIAWSDNETPMGV